METKRKESRQRKEENARNKSSGYFDKAKMSVGIYGLYLNANF